MRFLLPLSRLPKLLLRGMLELGLVPLRLTARLLGVLVLAVAAIGIPAWLIQLCISLLGGGNGGGPVPPWAMILMLAAAIPMGISALRLADLRGPRSRADNPDAHAEFEYLHSADDSRHGGDARHDDSSSGDPDWITRPVALAWAYEALDLDPGVSPSEVKAAYRRLVRLHHPDHNPGIGRETADRLTDINVAYEALLRQTRRARVATGEQGEVWS
ncbi:MAG TPA: J domain-containing protein [Solirubrobacteraceae bacterium]|nr:J domain-containing protein [Solirubrobacteraceae bacterium]